jgi:MscS family membrane protein
MTTGLPNHRGAARRAAGLILALLGSAFAAPGQEAAHPLRPPDRSSPRAALATFLEAGDAAGAFMAGEYLRAPSRAGFRRLVTLGDAAAQSLDVSGMAPAARAKTARAATLALYGTLSRIELPPPVSIPGPDSAGVPPATNVARWVVPNTEIALVRVESGPRSGEYLFSPETVARAESFYARVQERPYTRPVPLPNLREIVVGSGGWMIPHAWTEALPGWLRKPLGGQAIWKWCGLAVVLGGFGLGAGLAFRLSRRGSDDRPFLKSLAQAALPAYFLAGTPAAAYLALVQLNLRGGVGGAVVMAATAVMFLAGAWISWRIAPVVAEAIIASPRIKPESIDAHLIRICTRLLGMLGGATLLAMGADRLGLPVYGIIAGLGVGGLAIALAAQPTIENLIGGLSLFADRPICVGDICRCGDAEGTVEAIGIRSTRLRGVDRSLAIIPNATLSKEAITNLTERDRILLQTVLGVRYETGPDQFRALLGGIRALLLNHPRIAAEGARVRFTGFGASSLDLEVFAYVLTGDWAEFLAIREELLLRIMDLVGECGTGFAFPSQTVYLAQDEGPEPAGNEAAKARMRQWPDRDRPATDSRQEPAP